MPDLTIPIIGLTTLFGYLFSKDGKSPRQTENIRQTSNPNTLPTGDNIYTSDKVNEIYDEMLKRSMDNYKLAQDPAKTGVLPPLYNSYSSIGKREILDRDSNEKILSTNSETLKDFEMINKLVDVKSNPLPSIENRPMFMDEIKNDEQTEISKNMKLDNYKNISSNKETFDNVSSLTGLPMMTEHNNMIPFFGSNVKQNTKVDSNTHLLDLHTGNNSTYFKKEEVGPIFDTQEENIYGNPVFSASVNTDRFIPSLFKENEKPFQEERIKAPISGTIENKIRPEFKKVNQLRPGNDPKLTYKGRILSGKFGEVPGYQSDVEKNRPDTYYKQGADRYLVTNGSYIAKTGERDYSSALQQTGRQQYNASYFGTSKHEVSNNRQTLSKFDNSNELLTPSIYTESIRNNFENDYIRNAGGNNSTLDYGKSSYVAYETERQTTEDKTQLSNPTLTEMGKKVRLQDQPKTTVKETTLYYDNTGYVKSDFNTGKSSAYASGLTGVDAKTTNKEMTSNTEYFSSVQTDKGLGYLVNKYDPKTTNKEIISAKSEYTGIANRKNKNPVSRKKYENAEFSVTKEKLLTGSRPSGPENFQLTTSVNTVGDTKLTENMKLKSQEDKRHKIHGNYDQIISDISAIGAIQLRKDNSKMETVTGSRLIPELIQSQMDKNPLSIYAKK